MATKVIEAIRHHVLREKSCPHWPMKIASYVENDQSAYSMLEPSMHLVRFDVKFEYRQRCLTEDIPHALKNTKRAVAHLLYDEIREKLIQLDKAIYEHDADKAKELIGEILEDTQI